MIEIKETKKTITRSNTKIIWTLNYLNVCVSVQIQPILMFSHKYTHLATPNLTFTSSCELSLYEVNAFDTLNYLFE